MWPLLLALLASSSREPRLGPPRVVYFDDSPNITIAMGLLATQRGELYAAAGSWGLATDGSGWGSYVRRVLPTLGQKDTGGRPVWGHETAGSDVVAVPSSIAGTHTDAVAAAAAAYAFEADERQTSGGPALYGAGAPSIANGSVGGAYWWQGVSAIGGTVVAAATLKFGHPTEVHVFVSTRGGAVGSFERVEYANGTAIAAGVGVAVHQLAVPVSGEHLVFRTAYRASAGGANSSAALVVVTPCSGLGLGSGSCSGSGSGSGGTTIRTARYVGLPAGAQGVNTGALVAGVAGVVVGTYSGDIAWRGGSAAAVGVLTSWSHGRATTTRWLRLGGADVTAIQGLGDAAPRTFAALVEDCDAAHGGNKVALVRVDGDGKALVLLQTVKLTGAQTGGLALMHGSHLFAAHAHGPSGKPPYPARAASTGNVTVSLLAVGHITM